MRVHVERALFFRRRSKKFFFFKTLRWWRAESGLLVPSRKERIGILGKKGGGECGNNLLSFVFRLGGGRRGSARRQIARGTVRPVRSVLAS